MSGWLQEALARQDELNQIRMLRLEAFALMLCRYYVSILEWLDTAETLADPYERED